MPLPTQGKGILEDTSQQFSQYFIICCNEMSLSLLSDAKPLFAYAHHRMVDDARFMAASVMPRQRGELCLTAPQQWCKAHMLKGLASNELYAT